MAGNELGWAEIGQAPVRKSPLRNRIAHDDQYLPMSFIAQNRRHDRVQHGIGTFQHLREILPGEQQRAGNTVLDITGERYSDDIGDAGIRISRQDGAAADI